MYDSCTIDIKGHKKVIINTKGNKKKNYSIINIIWRRI